MADETEHYSGALNLTGAGNDEPPRLGKHAYLAYCASTGGKSLVSGAPLPSWEDQDPQIQDAWEAAATAVQREILD